ncbi:hypothetical protein WJX75_001106 [Coccomyxa subellipsoidea]|uniref:Sm domain-containing protein n=1 Tax=Coccomyxa subellipsoidea TaxID=248742 RepID=A0ABR2YEL1_9CHLO
MIQGLCNPPRLQSGQRKNLAEIISRAHSLKLRKTMTRRIPRSERSLACFVQALEGLNIAVELHNDAVIRGMLESADEGMNLIITGATYEPLQGVTREMDFLFLRGARIRYFHLPAKINAATRVEEKQKEITKARRLHAVEIGQLTALPKGVEALAGEGKESQRTTE